MAQIICPGCEKQIPSGKSCPYCKTPLSKPSGGLGFFWVVIIILVGGIIFLADRSPKHNASLNREEGRSFSDNDVASFEYRGAINHPVESIELNEHTEPYSNIIFAAVNSLSAQNHRCAESIDLSSVEINTHRNELRGARFFVTCNHGGFSYKVAFSEEDILSGKDFSAPAPSAKPALKPASKSSPSRSSLTEIKLQRLAREQVQAQIKDPSSAQFRNQKGACGEVNAKNAFGAYTGFQRFMAGSGIVFMERDSGIEPAEFEVAWRRLCG